MNGINETKVRALEQSLIQYLMNRKEVEEKMGTAFRRVRGIQLVLDKSSKHVTFTVQIGMFEATFDARTGLKEKGNCFNIERYIRDWAERESVRNEMMALTHTNINDAK